MKAGIDFTIHKNFDQFIKMDGWDADYSDALVELNKLVKELVEKDKLVFKYNNKKTRIVLPIEMNDCGNIFSKEDYYGDCWEGVTIWCEISDIKDFDSKKLKVTKSPIYFEAECVVW